MFTLAILGAAVTAGPTAAAIALVPASLFGLYFAGVRDTEAVNIVEAAVFLLSAIAIIWLAANMQRSRARVVDGARYAERQAAEADLLAEELNLLIDGVQGYAIYMLDADGRVAIWNQGAERLTGWSEGEITGHDAEIFYPADAIMSGKPARDRAQAVVQGRVAEEDRRVRRDGTEFLADISITALWGGAGELRGFGTIVSDITERRRTEARVEALQSELLHVSRLSAMGTMAATLAHELNQPLTAVTNYVETARDLLAAPGGEDMSTIRDALEDSAKEAMRAGRIVRRLRDFVARGEVEKTVENLPALIKEAAHLALVGAREKGIEPCFDIDPRAPSVLVDRVQIQQVVINLVRNAIEAMADSPVRRLAVSSRFDQSGFVRITVADTGPGVAPDVEGHLFTAFTSTKNDGMGLGLSICRTIIEANGGRIWMEARSGGGTEFHFTLLHVETERDE